MNNPVKEQMKTMEGAAVPVLDIPMMSDEQWAQKARENAMQHYIREHGHEPMDPEEAYKWQRERFCKECAMV